MKFSKLTTLSILALVLLAAACSPSATPDADAISTAAAQTVEARFTQMAENTSTPAPETATTDVSSMSTPTVTATATAVPVYSGNGDDCLKANLVSETVPDGTLYSPGEYFWKSWYVKNSGTCAWDSTYKFVYWSGELMGGAVVYNLPGAASPGETLEIPIQLVAPTVSGSYRGYWKIQSPSGQIFGVGEYDQPMWVDIVVSDANNPDYAITSVQYSLTRSPEYGCPANVSYTITATIITNGPVDVTSYWMKSDGTRENNKILKFKEAGSKTVSVTWTLNKGAPPNPRWVMLVTDLPTYHEYGQYTFVSNCPDQRD